MLSSRQNVVCINTVSAPLASADVSDIDVSDNDDDDNVRSSNNNNTWVMVNESFPDKSNSKPIIHDQASNGVHRQRPSTINLRPLIADNILKVSDNDITDGCFGGGAADDSEHGSNGQGINIQFQDLIYRARHKISWDRCKYNSFFEINETKRKNRNFQFSQFQCKRRMLCNFNGILNIN